MPLNKKLCSILYAAETAENGSEWNKKIEWNALPRTKKHYCAESDLMEEEKCAHFK